MLFHCKSTFGNNIKYCIDKSHQEFGLPLALETTDSNI